jgi:hypothetical protein
MQNADLEPVDTTSGRLIIACFTLQHLDHETFTPVFNTLIKECLNVLRLFALRRFGKLKLKVNRFKVLPQKLSPF